MGLFLEAQFQTQYHQDVESAMPQMHHDGSLYDVVSTAWKYENPSFFPYKNLTAESSTPSSASPVMENPHRTAAHSDGDEEISDKKAVFIDTNLDTHLALIVSFDDTVFHLKQRMLTEHTKCFPHIGEIEIHAVKVKRKGHYYHLPESMFVFSAFHGTKTNWFLFAEASSRVGLAFENGQNIRVDDPSRALSIVVHSAVPLLATNQVADQGLHASDRLGGVNFMCPQMMVDHNNEDNHEGCLSHNTMKLRAEMMEKLHEGFGNDAVISTHTESLEGGRNKRRKRKKHGPSGDAFMENDEDGVFAQHAFVQKDSDVADLSAKGASPYCSFLKPGNPGRVELELAPSKCPESGGSSLRLSNIQGRESGEHKIEVHCRSDDADCRTSTLNKRARKKRKGEAVLEDHDALLATTGAASGMGNEASDTFTGDAAGVANVITEVAWPKNDEDGVFLPHAFVQKDTAVASLSAKGSSPDHPFTKPGSPRMLDYKHAPSKLPGMSGSSLWLPNVHEMVTGEHKVEDQCISVDADSRMNIVKKKGGKKKKKNQATSDHDSMIAVSGANSQMGNGVSDTFNDSVAGVGNVIIGHHVAEIDGRKSLDAADFSDSMVQTSHDPSGVDKDLGTSVGNGDDRTRERIGDGQNRNLLGRVLQSELADEKESRGVSKISLRNVVPTSAEEVSKQDTKITKHDIGGREILEKEVVNSDDLVTKTIDDASLSISSKDKGKKKRKRSDSDSESQVSLHVLPSLTAGKGETSDNMVEDGGEKFVKDFKVPVGIPTLSEDRNEVPAKFEGTSASVDNARNSEREPDAAEPVPLHGAKKKKRKKNVGGPGSHQSSLIEDPEVLKSSEPRGTVHGSSGNHKDAGHASEGTALPVAENDADMMTDEHGQWTSDGREEVVFSLPSAGKKRKTKKSKKSNPDNQDISTTGVAIGLPADNKPDNGDLSEEADKKENISLQNKKVSHLDGDRIPDDRFQNVEASLQNHEEHEENAVIDGEKRKRKKRKKTLSVSLLCNGGDGTSDDLCRSEKPHQLEESAGTNKEQKTKTKRYHNLAATNSVRGVDGESDDDRQKKEVKLLPLSSQNEQPEEGMKTKAERKKKKTLSASVFANGVDATSNESCISKGQFQLGQPDEGSAGKNSEQNRRTEQNDSLRATRPSHSIDEGAGDDDGQNKEAEPLVSSQNEQPEESMGNKINDEPGRGAKKQQHFEGTNTGADVKDGEADQMSLNEVEPLTLGKVDKPGRIGEKEIGKPKKSIRRKPKLSGEGPSAEEEDPARAVRQERIKDGRFLELKTREGDTYTATKEMQSGRASSINQLMDAENEVEMGTESWHPQQTDRDDFSADLNPCDKGLSLQISGIPQKDKEGSERESPEQEVASEGENGGESAEKKLEEKDNSRKDHGGPSSVDTWATGQSLGKSNRSRVGKGTTENKKEEYGPLSGASARATKPGESVTGLGNSDRDLCPRNTKLDRYRVSFRKLSEGKKPLVGRTSSLFQDASSGSSSSEDEGMAAASADLSTRTPSYNSDSDSSDDSGVSSKAGVKVKNSSSSNDVELTSLLKRSRRFKEAQLTAASQAQEEEGEESEDVEFVPESEPM